MVRNRNSLLLPVPLSSRIPPTPSFARSMPFSMLGQSSKLVGNSVSLGRPVQMSSPATVGKRAFHMTRSVTKMTRTRSNDACASHHHQRICHCRAIHSTPLSKSVQGTWTPGLVVASIPAAARRGTAAKAHQVRERSTIAELFRGNEEYMAAMSKDNPGLLASLAREGQRPPFMLVDCSDSRVNEQGIFSAQPGTIFTAGNIANRFDETDPNSNAVLSFAVQSLKVKHVVVLGHYGCGGVAAAMQQPPPPSLSQNADCAVQKWISPIRKIYETSNRPEIVAHREKQASEPQTTPPDLHDPAFRALVEENVKSNVFKIANSAVVRDLFAASAVTLDESPSSSLVMTGTGTGTDPIDPNSPELYIHGWVYDVENGRVSDLRVSVGPPGRELPFSPFPVVQDADSISEMGKCSC